MFKYLVILLDKAAPSFCHYTVPEEESQLMPLDILRKAIRFGMVENLNIQLVMPKQDLPKEHLNVISEISASKIASYSELRDADVFVLDNPFELPVSPIRNKSYVVRVDKDSFAKTYQSIVDFSVKVNKVNVVFTDVDSFDSNALTQYEAILEHASGLAKGKFIFGHTPQINILTDRILLEEMNNCNAGWESITVAPDGKFYVCPAFYYDEEGFDIGNVDTGVNIKNPQLYKLDHAPLCRDCDAFQCKRCIWLNRKLTKEVGIPSKQQCVMSHIERNASRLLLLGVREHGEFLPDKDVPEIDYLDPFENKLKKDKEL